MILQVLPAASFQHSHLCPGAKANLLEFPYIQQDQNKFKTRILATWIRGLKSGFTGRYIYKVEEKSPEQQFEGNIHDILTSRHYK
jgi:hypothetical protein